MPHSCLKTPLLPASQWKRTRVSKPAIAPHRGSQALVLSGITRDLNRILKPSPAHRHWCNWSRWPLWRGFFIAPGDVNVQPGVRLTSWEPGKLVLPKLVKSFLALYKTLWLEGFLKHHSCRLLGSCVSRQRPVRGGGHPLPQNQGFVILRGWEHRLGNQTAWVLALSLRAAITKHHKLGTL